MIEIRAAQAARNARQQMQLFERRARRSERAELRAAVLLGDCAEPLGDVRRAPFPSRSPASTPFSRIIGLQQRDLSL